jgi:hypothetical protein
MYFRSVSDSKINYEKTKGLFIGRLRGKRPRLTNISWISDNIKTLGVFHGYNIDTDDIWKKITRVLFMVHQKDIEMFFLELLKKKPVHCMNFRISKNKFRTNLMT